MKKIITILLICIMLPFTVFAEPSPVIKNTIHCVPEITFEMAEESDSWWEIYEWLYSIRELTDGYTIVDAVYITLDQNYDNIKWYLSIPINDEHEPFAFIMDEDTLIMQELPTTNDNAVIVNFEEFEPNNYYVCFFIKDAA